MKRCWWIGMTGLVALMSCTGAPSTDGPEAPPDAPPEEPDTGTAAAPEASTPLRPRLQEVGPAGVTPAQLVIHTGRDFFDGVQTVPEGNKLELSPAVDGRLERLDGETLAFVPATGFAPGTTYTATLTSVSNGDETVEGSWSRTFTTPDFGLVRAALHSRDLESGVTEVDLVFSAPVSVTDVSPRVQLSLRGQALRAQVLPGDRPEEVRFRFSAPGDLEDDDAVQVSLKGGVPWAADRAVTAGAESRSVPLKLGPPVEILATQLKEGRSGFYLDVVCRDEAVESERYYWDEDTWDGWWVTSRCMLSAEQVAAMVRTSPAVDLTVAPAGAGFRLFGDFPRGDYTLEIDAGAKTVDGGVLPKAHSHRFRIGQRSPRISFASQGRYLPRESWDQLAIRHLNLSSAELTVRHVPPQNLVFWMSGEESTSERTADTVFQDDVSLSSPEDAEATTWLDVGRLLPNAGRGIYELTLEGEGATATARLMLTDLQLIAKRAPGEDGRLWAWVLDAHNGAPIQGVDVSVIQPSGREVAGCRTPLGGGCVLELEEDPLNPTAPLAILAERGGDMTYLKFSELELSPESDVSGLPYHDAAGYHAAVMTERGVYRPGETVHLSMIARGEDHTAPESPLPVVLTVFDARGRELRRLTRTTDALGVLADDIGLSDFAVLGRYRVTVTAGERTLGETTFNVEEFVPERMAAEVSVLGAGVRPTDAASVEVSARWLFGGNAADSRVELTCSAEPAAFRPEKNGAYHYGPAQLGDAAARPVVLGVIEGMLDDEGTAGLSCPPAGSSGASLGAGRLVARAAVFEGDSGRSTVETATAPLHPEDYYVGLRANVESLSDGEQATIDGIVVGWGGERDASATDSVTVEIFRLEEEIGWVWDENTGSSIRRSQLRHVREDEQTVTVSGGSFSFPFTAPGDGAGYLLVARSGDAETELHIQGEGRRYWWDPGSRYADQTPRPERPAPLPLELPDEIRVGEAVTVSTVAPYSGQILWAVETDGVVESHWETIQAGEATWSFSLDAFEPNVYVSALLIKDPHLESRDAYLPARAFAVESIRVRPEAYLHAVSLVVPDEVTPNSPLTVQLQVDGADGPTVATVAAVDEGILQLTDFESPDPTTQIFAQRALGVETFETVGWSLANSGGPGSRTGGDADGGGPGRVQMVKPVSLWSGLVDVKDGRAEVTLDVPSYRGKLRVMAVTADQGHVGSADAEVVVRDPLVLQTTLPRFLTAGDAADVPVFVSNMTGKDGEITVSLSTEELDGYGEADSLIAPVSVEGPASQPITLAAGASGSVVFRVRADRAPAAARFTVRATGNGQTSYDSLEVPIAPAQPEVRRAAHVSIAAGQQLDLSRYLSGWLPGSDRSTIWLSANPYGGAFSHLRYLIKYPYGCIEQTTSSTRPLLYVSTLLDNVDPGLTRQTDLDAMVRSGIERVASMQTADGGFAYWPGGTRPELWPTAYATHMLLDAKDQGRSLPKGLLDRALDWMGDEVVSADDRRGAAYAHYVLARAEQPQTADAQRRLEQLSGDRPEERTLLMAAIQRAGLRTHEAELKAPDLTPVSDTRVNDWSFYSDRRRRALTLNVLEELFPGDPAIEPLAALVADAIDDRESSFYTTQELAWAVSGLGKRVSGLNADLGPATLRADGDTLAASETGAQGTTWQLWSHSRYDSLSLTAPQADKPMYLHVTTDGVRASEPPKMGGAGLLLTRSYLNGAGEPVDPSRHALGDLLYVKVTIQNTASQPVQNIALVDRIPAGWEIENPRLGRAQLPDWAEGMEMWGVEHMNLRDNRLEVFGSLRSSQERTVLYAVRAVTAGRFTQPDISAEAMYEPRIWARQPGTEIEITAPWAAAL